MVRTQVGLAVPPGGDAAHDEELLAGLNETEPPRFADELLARAYGGDPGLQLALFGLEPADLRLPVLEHRVGVLVVWIGFQ